MGFEFEQGLDNVVNIKEMCIRDSVAALRRDAEKGDALLFKGSRGMRMERALAWFLGEDVEE